MFVHRVAGILEPVLLPYRRCGQTPDMYLRIKISPINSVDQCICKVSLTRINISTLTQMAEPADPKALSPTVPAPSSDQAPPLNAAPSISSASFSASPSSHEQDNSGQAHHNYDHTLAERLWDRPFAMIQKKDQLRSTGSYIESFIKKMQKIEARYVLLFPAHF